MIDTPATEAETVARIIRGDPWRWRLLGLARALRLSDGWVAAGLVRNAVWDHLPADPRRAPAGMLRTAGTVHRESDFGLVSVISSNVDIHLFACFP